MSALRSEAEKVLARIVDGSRPRSLLCCGDTAAAVARHWCRQRPDTRLLTLDSRAAHTEWPDLAGLDLALVSEALERLPHGQGERLLGQLRNYGTRRIAVLVRDGPAWTFTDFIGLGFRRHAQLDTDAGPLTLYTYNLDTYNHEREWNNPRNWAHPEMWGRAWW